jgi:hypothetical protein
MRNKQKVFELAGDGLSRRELFSLSAQLALAISAGGFLGSALVGCGGSAALQPYTLNGTVALNEVGGSGLVLRTVFGTANLGSTGNVSIDTALDAAKMAVVHDTADHARGLGVLKPSGGGSDTFRIDADSTALSFVFLTPGIATSEPAEWQTRAARIRSLASYPALVALLRGQMPAKTLEEILASPEFLTALLNCVTEYADIPSGTRDIVPQPGQAFCEIKVADQSNPHAVRLQIENSAWRYASVFRRELDSGGAVLDLHDLGQIAGGKPFSFGSILATSYGTPTVVPDPNLDFGNYAKCEYWLFGPGMADMATAPRVGSEVAPDFAAALGKSILVYMLFPVLDLLTGVAGDLNAVMNVVDEIWEAISTSVDLTDLISAMAAQDWEEALASLTDASEAVATATLSSNVLVTKGLLSAAANSFLAFVLSVAGIGMAAGNMVVALYNWWLIPSAAHITVEGTGDGHVIVR